MYMTERNIIDFRSSITDFKKANSIDGDPDGILEQQWLLERKRRIEAFEAQYPGIREEFEKLISLLPDPDNPNKEEFPFAASIVTMQEGRLKVLASATNEVNKKRDSTGHAEMVAMKLAQQEIGDKHLRECMLLSTAQPCAMCAGAAVNTDVGTVVYAMKQKELKRRHVKFPAQFKNFRTTPDVVDVDELLLESGIHVVAGYKHEEVVERLVRTPHTFVSYYNDPDEV